MRISCNRLDTRGRLIPSICTKRKCKCKIRKGRSGIHGITKTKALREGKSDRERRAEGRKSYSLRRYGVYILCPFSPRSSRRSRELRISLNIGEICRAVFSLSLSGRKRESFASVAQRGGHPSPTLTAMPPTALNRLCIKIIGI